MTLRSLLVGALFAVLCLATMFASDRALAAKMKAGMTCAAAALPQCIGLYNPRCEKKNGCGACAKWACAPVLSLPFDK
jgi:hypothetical protein